MEDNVKKELEGKTKDEMYEYLHRQIGKKYRVSSKIIQYIRSFYSNRYVGKEDNFKEGRIEIRKYLENKIIEVNRSWRAIKLDYINVLTQQDSLRSSSHRISEIKKLSVDIIGHIERMSFRNSALQFLQRISDEQFEEIIETHL